MDYEEKTVFKYVDSLIKGVAPKTIRSVHFPSITIGRGEIDRTEKYHY